jgi:hypothetical protein
VIHISFIDEPVTDATGKPLEKIHSLFQTIERDSGELLLHDMELHYIDMQSFLRYLTKRVESKEEYDKFTKWLSFITQKEIKDKRILRELFEGDNEMREATEALRRISAKQHKRHSRERKRDNIYFAEKEKRERDAIIADQKAIIADKDAALAKQEALIAELKTQLDYINPDR